MSDNPLRHAMARMGGRDPHEQNRVSTPLELFFDLTFAIAFGAAANLFAHSLAGGHVGTGIISFSFVMFAIIWAWINFSWFASAYDTDDWVFRLVTMVQMLGVLILSLGLEPVFVSIQQRSPVDNGVMVLGYVVMRVALIFQWLRAAKQDPQRRATCLSYAKYLAVAQVGWIVVILVDTEVWAMLLIAGPLFVLEMAAPVIAERKTRTPWHAHHIAERYSLLAIIALGECLVGTITALRAVLSGSGWSLDMVAVGLAGIGLAFAMWWMYFMVPAGTALHAQRERSFVFGYAHMLLFASITATGVGLRVYAYYLEGKTQIGEAAVVASVAIPAAVFAIVLTFLHAYMVAVDPLQLWLAAALLVCSAAAIALAMAGLPLTLCLAMILAMPTATIILDELIGHRNRAAALDRLTGN
ncbi:low temperature requirement protein A [Paeniglutamicibacter kerguelensis]|uniref:Low temperature requirement protein LtrA n=1 Tax=Paeniglutamicibacter kerguelensis TaxID=254788 RepID=A0ABS4XGG3_9MICC|nr:low temperature requirement protein A [Paeniglutamicibacter kerguelensis]MBP2387436.1 low temperature requirement protein LtrA [Paeniglutamicibacter kerguelensis]